MHYTLEEVLSLTPLQFNWVVRELEEQKKEEAKAFRR
jgi:hypothetical protein